MKYHVYFYANEIFQDTYGCLDIFPRPVQLKTIISRCKKYGVDAELMDAAGFDRGYVKRDGDYSIH